jgi:hypothetical protein
MTIQGWQQYLWRADAATRAADPPVQIGCARLVNLTVPDYQVTLQIGFYLD